MKKIIAFTLGLLTWMAVLELVMRWNEFASKFKRCTTYGRER